MSNEKLTSPRIPFFKMMHWVIARKFRQIKKDITPLEVITHSQLPQGEYAMWIGHATVWMRLSNTTVAIDPILGNVPMYPRQTTIPLNKEQLKADVVLITHAHYDHYDKTTIKYMLSQNPNLIIVAPTGFSRYIKTLIDSKHYFEIKWWESVMVGGLSITLVPSKHWSRRTLFDTNKALWGGYIIQNKERTIYHSGDTAIGEHFKEIGERFKIDEAFLPIGAYKPEWIMNPNHMNPEQAFIAAHDLGAQTIIPIHYGTFNLSDEPLDEPLEWFLNCASNDNTPLTKLVLKIGEIYPFLSKSVI